MKSQRLTEWESIYIYGGRWLLHYSYWLLRTYGIDLLTYWPAPTYHTHACTLRTHRPAFTTWFPCVTLIFVCIHYTVYIQILLHKDLCPLSSVYYIFNWIEPLLNHCMHAWTVLLHENARNVHYLLHICIWVPSICVPSYSGAEANELRLSICTSHYSTTLLVLCVIDIIIYSLLDYILYFILAHICPFAHLQFKELALDAHIYHASCSNFFNYLF